MHGFGLLAVRFRREMPLIKPGAIWVVGAEAPAFRLLKFHKKSTSCGAESTTL